MCQPISMVAFSHCLSFKTIPAGMSPFVVVTVTDMCDTCTCTCLCLPADVDVDVDVDVTASQL